MNWRKNLAQGILLCSSFAGSKVEQEGVTMCEDSMGREAGHDFWRSRAKLTSIPDSSQEIANLSKEYKSSL